MARTKTQLRNAVLLHLKAIAANEDPSSEDATTVETAIDNVYDELQEQELAYWSSSSIPNAVFEPLKQIVAADVAGNYLSETDAAVKRNERKPAMARLREVVAEPNDGSPIPVTYF